MTIKTEQIQALTDRLARSHQKETSINSSDAIEMISHSSEFIIDILTPIGRTLTTTTKFIGYHSNGLILIEFPEISRDEINTYLQEGFWMNVRAFSQKGEGAIIKFRCQIMHTVTDILPMVMLSVPSSMYIQQLRKEPRYDVKLLCRATVNDHKAQAEIRDLSKSGCRFIISSLTKDFNVGDEVILDVTGENRELSQIISLTGHLCNSQGTRHYAKYGVKFDEFGQKGAKALLSNMRFNGTQFVLKKKTA